jgi:hypothetical protein
MSRFEPIVRSWSAISRSLPARRPHARRRFTLERLEERAMLSTIPVATNLTVSSLADSGVGTLRAAIMQADTGTGNQYVIAIGVRGHGRRARGVSAHGGLAT